MLMLILMSFLAELRWWRQPSANRLDKHHTVYEAEAGFFPPEASGHFLRR
jgi:hypothetical protein